MIENIFVFIASIVFIVKGSTLATKYSFQIARYFRLSKYVVGFIVVAIISIIPETLISLNSALEKVPSLGLGTLFGSNIADLTLVLAIIIFFAGRGITVESKILKENAIYPLFLIIPIALGFDGYYSIWEGLVLVISGLVFYYLAFKNNSGEEFAYNNIEIDKKNKYKNIMSLIFGMIMLLVGSHFIVTSSIGLANALGINSVVVGMLFLGLGTTIPELSFCMSAVIKNHDSLAIGDILGTVLADATVVVGILAMISPFSFPQRIIYSAGIFMILSSLLLFYFMRSGRYLSKKESYMLALFWLLFALIEIAQNVL